MIINYDINNKGGGASAEGCVRYDEAQDLTAEQQEQAKENLGIEEPEPQEYEVSSLDEIPAGTANQIYADYKDGKTVLVKESTLFGLVNYFSVVSAKSDKAYNYFTLSGKNCLYELKSAKNPSYGELATLTSTTIPTVNDPTVTINQGGVAKGSFTLNQSGAATIDLDAGSSPEGCLRYDQAQTLTDAQKTQALSNIGAAPFIAEAVTLPSLTKSQVLELYEAFIAGRPTFVKAKISMTTTAEPVFLQVILAEHNIIGSRQIYYLLVIYRTERYTITLTDSTVSIGISTFIDDTYNDGNMYVRKKGLWIRLPDIPQPENHQLLKSALSEPMGCSANTWATLAELNVPEDGAYQVSASARMLPADQSTAFKTATVSIELGTDAAGYTEVMEMTLPRSGEYGTLSVPVNATAGQKLRLRAISEANFYAQASPSAGKASATFIAAVRVGAIYQAQ